MGWVIQNVQSGTFSFQELDTFVPRNIRYLTSSSELYADDGVVHNHHGSDTLDGNKDTFWLSVGNSTPSATFAVEWIEFEVNELINIVGIYPYAGNYTCYVSVEEQGHWRGKIGTGGGASDDVPYDPGLTGIYVGDNAADIRFVQKGGVPWETPILFHLARPMAARKIRLSFSNLALTQWGPYNYRCGLREVTVGFKKP